jgi:hypothetical protein
MPPPGGMAGMGVSFLGFSASIASVVNTIGIEVVAFLTAGGLMSYRPSILV